MKLSASHFEVFQIPISSLTLGIFTPTLNLPPTSYTPLLWTPPYPHLAVGYTSAPRKPTPPLSEFPPISLMTEITLAVNHPRPIAPVLS
ncbi:hypothetical protein BDZ94DRAFT_855404 [Collybia nuda]|uniref:Uncharacterized protein n=1 Tax=Collybia nuda TaxID=64659 RepID=A0A9P6CCX8_9AGAR|nr:hypothetical protein BDZ94DRAFT_855404 [Collybia nuda]